MLIAGDGPARTAVRRLAGVTVAAITGCIDDRFDGSVLQGLAGEGIPVVLDLDRAMPITSFGIREWRSALHPFTPSTPLFFARTRPCIVAQFNSVAQFDGGGSIVSLYCPYICVSCDATFEVLTDVRKSAEQLRRFAAPEVACPSCGATPAEFDDLEAAFFAHVAGRSVPELARAVAALFDDESPDGVGRGT